MTEDTNLSLHLQPGYRSQREVIFDRDDVLLVQVARYVPPRWLLDSLVGVSQCPARVSLAVLVDRGHGCRSPSRLERWKNIPTRGSQQRNHIKVA